MSFHPRFRSNFSVRLAVAPASVRGGRTQTQHLLAVFCGRKLVMTMHRRAKIADVPWGIYASHSFVERHGRSSVPDINDFSVIELGGRIGDGSAARWREGPRPKASCSEMQQCS
jgi:hypothetical protein